LAVGADGTQFSTGYGFEAVRGSVRRVGLLPPLGGSSFRSLVLPDGRIVIAGGGRVATSGDLGLHWRTTDLPDVGAVPTGTIGPAFTDARHGLVVASSTPSFSSLTGLPAGPRTGPGVWRTDNGGRTWQTVIAPEPAAPNTRDAARPRTSPDPPPSPSPRLTATALEALTDGSYVRALDIARQGPGDEPPAIALERSSDQGRTWTRLLTRPETAGGERSPINTIGRLASGRLVVPLGGTRDSRTNAPTIAVVDPATGVAVDRPSPVDDPEVLCDPAGACQITPGDTDTAFEERSGLAFPFDGETFGTPRPSLPYSAVSPRPGTIVGIRSVDSDLGTSAPIVRSDDGGATYTPGPVRPSATFDDHHVTIRALDDGWHVSRDAVRWSSFPPPPTRSAPVAASSAPGGLVALFADDTILRLRDGRWRSPVDARKVSPQDVAAVGSTIVVAGRDGVARLDGERLAHEVRAKHGGPTRGVTGPTKDLGIQYTDLETTGSTIVAYFSHTEGYPTPMIRSTDGGRSWRQIRSIAGVDDLQMLSSRTFYASRGKQFLVSNDAGRTFRLRGATDDLSFLNDAWPENTRYFVSFRDRNHGIVSSDYTGTFVTHDGGRTFQALPSPLGPFVTYARLTPRGVLTNGPMGTLISNPNPFAALRATRIDLGVARTLRTGSRDVTVRLTGRTRGIPAGSKLNLFSAPKPGALPTRASGNNEGPIISKTGTFTFELVVRRGFAVRARYGGTFATGTRRASALSAWVRMPGGR
jgi:photosystem II stability/assembly factor-like uncharacterized protein